MGDAMRGAQGHEERREVWGGAPARGADRLRPADERALEKRFASEFARLLAAPFRTRAAIESAQEARIAELIALAGETPLYRAAFGRAGVSPRSFRRLVDLSRFPVITKAELAAAYPRGCVRAGSFPHRYATFSSGSTGRMLSIDFDPCAVVTDTLHGARQLALQGGINPDDLTAYYYTHPWYADRIGDAWHSAFVSSLVTPAAAARALRALRPAALASYPSLLQALAPHIQPGELPLKLVITNSEQSSRAERDALGAHFHCPVLDEYSSEELTRIALEMPDGRYYVHEDSVHLEILDLETREPAADGEWGEAVVTGLLNEAMPFIRYATGDMVRAPAQRRPGWADMNWRQLDAIGGRVFDSFRTPRGAIIPSGALIDVMYRSFMECDTVVEQFELVQIGPARVAFGTLLKDSAIARTLAEQMREYLNALFETPVTIEHRELGVASRGKRRPVRRELE